MSTCVNSGALASHHASLASRVNLRSRSKVIGSIKAQRSTTLLVRAGGKVTDLPDEQRVVITGAGVVSTHGDDRDLCFHSADGIPQCDSEWLERCLLYGPGKACCSACQCDDSDCALKYTHNNQQTKA